MKKLLPLFCLILIALVSCATSQESYIEDASAVDDVPVVSVYPTVSEEDKDLLAGIDFTGISYGTEGDEFVLYAIMRNNLSEPVEELFFSFDFLDENGKGICSIIFSSNAVARLEPGDQCPVKVTVSDKEDADRIRQNVSYKWNILAASRDAGAYSTKLTIVDGIAADGSGMLRNDGDKAVEYNQVNVGVLDADGNCVAYQNDYLFERLAPGESVAFNVGELDQSRKYIVHCEGSVCD